MARLACFLIAVIGSSGVAVTVAVAKTKKRAAAKKPLTLPASKQKPAMWVSAAPATPPRFHLIAFDQTQALGASAEAPETLLAYTDKNGVEGPIALPKQTTWIGTGKGVIFAATDDGTLYRADTIAAARKDGLKKVQQVKGAVHWDAGGGALIVAAGRRVSVSTDGGATFRDHDFAADVAGVFARGDGVLVAVPEGSWAWVSNDGGKTWQAPPAALDPAQQQAVDCEGAPAGGGYGSWGDGSDGSDGADEGEVRPPRLCLRPAAPQFTRDGDLIVAYGSYGGYGGGCYDGWCHVEYNCMQGALAADGKTWVEPGERRYAYYDQPATPFDTLQRMVGYSVGVTAAPAANGKSAAEATRACLADPKSLEDRTGTGMGGGRGDCRGLGCLRYAPQPADDGTHAFFSDAVCDDKTATCTRPATRLSLGATGQIVLSRAPCGPGWLTSSQGTAVLECTTPKSASTQMFLGDRAGGWHAQDDLPVGGGVRIDIAADGTILAAAPCHPGKHCRAFVRAPAPLETHAAWREVTQVGALAYRVVAGGRALAVLPASQRKATPVVVYMGGYDSKPVFNGSYYDAWTDSYGKHPLEPIVEQCLTEAVGRLGPLTGTLAITAELNATAMLADVRVKDAPDKAAGDCLVAAARKLTYRKPPGAVISTRTIGYESADLRYSLWLLGGDKPVPVADQLDASDGLRDLNVIGAKIEIIVGEREYGARTGVLASDGGLIEQK